YSEAQARTLDIAADDDQRRMLQELADKRLVRFNEVVERHGAAQRQSWYDQVGDQRIAAMRADAALHWNSDALLRRALGTARAEVRERAERKGWDSPLTEAALRRETSRVLVSAIGAAVERDPERARSLRTRYAAVIEDTDRAALDALLAEAHTRERAQAASTEILNAAPPEGHHPTPQWRVRQADAITDPEVRAATIRRLNTAAATSEARARALGEQVLARVLKDGLTDPSQIPVSEWVALDAVRRQAIETRLDHNAAGTEPAPNPALVDELATQMTEAPHEFARRDLVPEIAHLPLPQWQRFRDWQAGIRRDDTAAKDEVYAIRRGFQIARQTLPALHTDSDGSRPSALSTRFRAALVEEIDPAHNLNGKPPDDAALRDMVWRSLPATPAHNIVMPVLDPETARRVARIPGQVLDELSLFMIWLLMNGIALELYKDRFTFPRSPSTPIPPPPLPRRSTHTAPSVPPDLQLPQTHESRRLDRYDAEGNYDPHGQYDEDGNFIGPGSRGQKGKRPEDTAKKDRRRRPSGPAPSDDEVEHEERRSRPPAGSLPIKDTPWSGDHDEIKRALGLRGEDNVVISPDGDVWVENPDGTFTNRGPAKAFTGSDSPAGRRGKDREANKRGDRGPAGDLE
ncbi:MAG: hypothetical protein AB7O88_27210, partial [Reyranellaceae bacterium]